MPKEHQPHSGSMQFWPRKRAERQHTPIRAWTTPLGKAGCFAGYKVGMTHLILVDSRKTAKTKGMELMTAATIIECPPMRVIGVRCYGIDKVYAYGERVMTDIVGKGTPDLSRVFPVTKKEPTQKLAELKAEKYTDIRVLVQTQPAMTSIKKRPEVFEVGLGGTVAQKLAWAQEKMGKDIFVNDVFAEGQQVDAHSVTTGRGLQGPVKRFGVAIRHHKSEKTKRGPGSLGAWKGQGHMMYRVAHAGQTGYHTRTEWNKWVLKMDTQPKNINPPDGFKRYGMVKNQYLIVKGSVGGPAKRLIKLTHPQRPTTRIPSEAPTIRYVSVTTKQGM
ncbi:MAG: 50S ribosomal protein L3 [Candidatus Woesearchaeota archaeon]|nr:50S ribosomal protein L3 [Candidatus Woesearchaeota archaeon]